jgi:hypothetical protein
MVCPHCGTNMVYEKFYGNNNPLCTWKCILCGEYVDDVIMKNRSFQELRRNRSKRSQTFLRESKNRALAN